MPKLHELTGAIISKESYKAYQKNQFYQQINYKLKVLATDTEPPVTIFVYANLVNPTILRTLANNHYLDQRYFFTCAKKKNGLLILQDWKKLNKEPP